MWTHNLGRSLVNQIDGTLLLPRQHNYSPIGCPMLMLTFWNYLLLHINNTHSHYPSKSKPKNVKTSRNF